MMDSWRNKGLEQNRNTIRDSRQAYQFEGGDLRSANLDHVTRTSGRGSKNWLDRLSNFTLHSASAGLASTLLIMCIFSFIGQKTDSRFAQAGELIVMIFWLAPDLLSIPFIGVSAAFGICASLLHMQGTNFFRNAIALAFSCANAYLVMYELLPLIMPGG